MFDGKAFGEEIVAEVRGFVGRVTGPLIDRIAVLEARAPEKGLDGKDGLDGSNGKDAAPVTREMILDAIEADPSLIADAVAKHIEANPPARGEPGKDGSDGLNGKDAEPVTVDLIAEVLGATPALVDEAVAKHLEANPPAPGLDGKDGRDGQDGVDGQKGIDGLDGKDGLNGKDGADVAGAMIDREGSLILTLSDGSIKSLGSVVGRDGTDGAPGPIGLGFDDLDVERPDERTILLKFTRGDLTQSFELGLAHPVYRGVFHEGQAYEPADMVTWAGAMWHCNASTTDKPGEGSSAWVLAVKKGRDGKDGRLLDVPAPGTPVKAQT